MLTMSTVTELHPNRRLSPKRYQVGAWRPSQEANQWHRVVTCAMAQRFAQTTQLFYKPDERNYDATSGRGHDGEDKTVEWRLYLGGGHICRDKFYRREFDQLDVFLFLEYFNHARSMPLKPFTVIYRIKATLPFWHIQYVNGQWCSRAGGNLLALS